MVADARAFSTDKAQTVDNASPSCRRAGLSLMLAGAACLLIISSDVSNRPAAGGLARRDTAAAVIAPRADLRGCTCSADWARAPRDASVCACGASALSKGSADTACPHFVDPAYLAFAHGHPECPPHARRADAVCSLRCSGVNAPVEWVVTDCSDQRMRAQPPCDAGASPLPFFLSPTPSFAPVSSQAEAVAIAASGAGDSAGALCRELFRTGHRAPRGALPNLTIGVLTHEAIAFAASLQTYEERGLLALINEVIVFMNKRSRAMDDALAPFARRWPGLFIVLDAGVTAEGSPDNWSVAAALNAMVLASKQRFFLLLERDFQLIEPDTCVIEQLRAAQELIGGGDANVVRMRSKLFEGQPNRAAELFKGKEHIAFELRHWGYPRYACNVYFWTEEPQKRYPDIFRECASPSGVPFVCATSMFCDWTNNPVLFETSWWQDKYLGPTKQSPGDAWDLEGFVSVEMKCGTPWHACV